MSDRDLTDLEMTRLCAEAMGYRLTITSQTSIWILGKKAGCRSYAPLTNSGDAFDLVKHLGLDVWRVGDGWRVRSEWSGLSNNADPDDNNWNENLNRAIVQCVAQMQKAKSDER